MSSEKVMCMPEKDPHTWSLFSVGVATVVSMMGGMLRYREEVRLTNKFSLTSFVFEMFVSCTVGLMAFWVCQDVLHQPEALCACAAAFGGNLGPNVFDIGRRILANQLNLKRWKSGSNTGQIMQTKDNDQDMKR